jgi:hypothetical protein
MNQTVMGCMGCHCSLLNGWLRGGNENSKINY